MLKGLRHYLNADGPPDEAAALALACSILSAVRLNPVEADPFDLEEFQQDLQNVEVELGDYPGPERMQHLAGAVAASIADYHARVGRRIKEQSTQLAQMVQMLTTAIGNLSAASEQSASRLKQIEQRLGSSLRLTDLAALRRNLEFCLDTIRQEAASQRECSSATVAMMERQLEVLPGDGREDGLQGPSPADGLVLPPAASGEAAEAPRRKGLDNLTGLPARAAAEQAMAEAIHNKAKVFVCLYSCQHVALINKRYGRRIGDKILETALRLVDDNVPSDCQLFKWSGRSFVGLLERDCDLAGVRAETHRHSALKVSTSVDLGNRSVMLPLLITMQIFRTFEYDGAAALFRDLDQYLYRKDKDYSHPPEPPPGQQPAVE